MGRVTRIAGPPVALEPPSAGFALDWNLVQAMHARRRRIPDPHPRRGNLLHRRSGNGRLLPFNEPYRIPESTARAISRARVREARDRHRTTVVRALEHAEGRAGAGLATQRIGPSTRLRVVDAIVSGTHERGTSHYELLRAFADDETLELATAELEARGYRTHEFGDSVWIERNKACHLPKSVWCEWPSVALRSP